LGPEACKLVLGVDDGFPVSDLDDILPGLLEGRCQIYMNLGEHLLWDHRLMKYLEHLAKQRSADEPEVGEIVTLGHLLHEQRLIKNDKEQDLMAQAARISVAAQYRALDLLRPGLTEADIEAELHYSFRLQGAKSEAYPSIVARGENACTLHYVQNESVLLEQDLVLIDAGCELQYYASDVTRTYPVSGRFSAAQRDVYDIVLAANRAAIEACRPGNHFNLPHEAATLVLVEGLIELGLLQGEPGQVIAQGDHDKFCPHKTSHWLGLDVHDVGDYRLGDAWRDLMPGMVLTVEPGIYIPRDDSTTDVPEPYRGLGIRIEDTVLIHKDGCQVLTDALIKEAAEIESRMAARLSHTDVTRVVA
jgi:Xaa-Pro aminopeptidase